MAEVLLDRSHQSSIPTMGGNSSISAFAVVMSCRRLISELPCSPSSRDPERIQC
jgi:hypothetical protein